MALSCIDLLDVISKWSYFVICILSLINCFIHLHLQLEAYECKSSTVDGTGNCIGRNLVWLTNGSGLRTDINYLYWRQIFSLQPDIFFNVWTPFIFSILAFAQNFKGFQVINKNIHLILKQTTFVSFIFSPHAMFYHTHILTFVQKYK